MLVAIAAVLLATIREAGALIGDRLLASRLDGSAAGGGEVRVTFLAGGDGLLIGQLIGLGADAVYRRLIGRTRLVTVALVTYLACGTGGAALTVVRTRRVGRDLSFWTRIGNCPSSP